MGIPKLRQDDPERKAYLEQIWLAWQEWQGAINCFENALEPDVIEYAVYNMEAKKRQYMFMVKYAREHLKLETNQLMRTHRL